VTWLSIIGAILSLVQSLITALHERKLIDGAVAEVMLKANQDSLNAIDVANKARQAARDIADRDPDSVLRDDDGHKRKD